MAKITQTSLEAGIYPRKLATLQALISDTKYSGKTISNSSTERCDSCHILIEPQRQECYHNTLPISSPLTARGFYFDSSFVELLAKSLELFAIGLLVAQP